MTTTVIDAQIFSNMVEFPNVNMAVNMHPSMHLQFGPWLMTQISSGKYLGLEWLDGKKMTLFKIPWTKINHPMWEEHHKIFQAWAIYRGKPVSPSGQMEQSYSQIKSNFRTILRKCVEIEEVEDCHQLGLQTGNYKVYRILTPEETVVKRKALSESKKEATRKYKQKCNKTSNVWMDCEDRPTADASRIKIYKAVDEITSEFHFGRPAKARRKEDVSDLTEPCELQIKFGPTRTISTQTSVEDYADAQIPTEPAASKETNTIMKETDLSMLEHTYCIKPPDNRELNSQKLVKDEDSPMKEEPNESQSSSTDNSHGFQMLLDAAELAEDRKHVGTTDADAPYNVETTLQSPPPLSMESVFAKLKISLEDVFTYTMHVSYEAKCVMDDVVLNDMSSGYRIQYENLPKKDSLTGKLQSVNEELTGDSFCLKTVSLPEFNVPPGNALNKVLRNIDAGLVLLSDERYTLCAKRLCLCRIYALSAYGETDGDSEPFLLIRNEEAILFSYHKFLKDFHHYLIKGSPKPNPEINLAFGRKIKHRTSRAFVSITIMPKAAEILLQRASSSVLDDGLHNALQLFNQNFV